MATIRVLQVFNNMGRGGAESMIMNYYRNMDRNKIQFDFLVHRKERADFDEEIETLGGVIYHIQPINPLFPKNYYKELRAFLKNHNYYKIIHSHLNTFSYFPLKIAEEFNIPTRIAHAHIAMDPITLGNTFKSIPNILEALKKIVKQQVKKKIHNHTTHYFSCSNKAGKWLFGRQIDFFIMNNAIDAMSFIYNPQKAKDLKKDLKLNNQIVLGHVGRFTHQKNHEYLLKIFAEVIKQNKQYTLILIGDGPLQNKIKEQAKNLGVSKHIQFLGVCTNIPELLQVLDVFVFPSFYEGLPVTLVEAQAAGLKILASDTIASEVKLTNDLQFLSINNSPKLWADTIIKLDFIKKVNNFQQIVDGNYDIISNTKEIEKFYHQQIKKS
tara:strand:- start:3525 stop:4670 length:1146 start_codon:yes stop_codon:yes gene_type:complete